MWYVDCKNRKLKYIRDVKTHTEKEKKAFFISRRVQKPTLPTRIKPPILYIILINPK